MAGCDWCFHVAASYHLWMRNYAPMYAVNVEGTRNVLEAAGQAGCQRIVYTSTVGLHRFAGGRQRPSGARRPKRTRVSAEDQLTGAYKRSKFQAEAVAMEVVPNRGCRSSSSIPRRRSGRGDVKPTPTGQIIVDFLNRRLPAYLDTGLNWVHVRDVAVGHILAAEKGPIGPALHFGPRAGQLDHGTNTRRPGKNHRLARPAQTNALLAGVARGRNQREHRFLHRQDAAGHVAGVRMARHKMWYNPGKAIRELGLPQTPPEQAFTDAVTWFRANGYVKTSRKGR